MLSFGSLDTERLPFVGHRLSWISCSGTSSSEAPNSGSTTQTSTAEAWTSYDWRSMQQAQHVYAALVVSQASPTALEKLVPGGVREAAANTVTKWSISGPVFVIRSPRGENDSPLLYIDNIELDSFCQREAPCSAMHLSVVVSQKTRWHCGEGDVWSLPRACVYSSVCLDCSRL